MDRIKKQLREWDGNLRDDTLPSNPIGTLPSWGGRLPQGRLWLLPEPDIEHF